MKKLLSILLLSTLLFLISCNKDEPEDEPTIEEIQQDIHQTFDGFVSCMQGYEDGQFSTALQSFLMISNGNINEDYAETLTDELGEFDFNLENTNILSEHSGVYDWNYSTEMWTYTANTNNELIFNFPFSANGSINNTMVTINAYELQMLSGEYYPIKFIASIEKDGNEFFNIDLDNATYEVSTEEVIPTSFELEILTAPMTHNFTLTKLANNEFKFDYSSHNDNSCDTTISIDATSIGSNMINIEDVEDLSTISMVIGHDALEIHFDVQSDNLSSIDNPTAVQINQLVDAKVFLNNSEIGELEVSDENNDQVVYIVFNDDTRENVENYVNDELAQELEAIFSNYIE